MNWLITLLGGVPAAAHATLSKQAAATRLALDEEKEALAKKELLREDSVRAANLLQAELDDKSAALDATAKLLKETVTAFEEERLESKEAAVALESKLAVALAEKKSAVEALSLSDASRSALDKAANQLKQERDGSSKELGLAKIQIENLGNRLVEAQSAAAYSQQRLDDVSASLEALRTEHEALVKASLPEKPEKKKR